MTGSAYPHLAASVLVTGCGLWEDPHCEAAEAHHRPETVDFTVLTWNVGNRVAEHPAYALRLADQAYEDWVGERLRERSPDIVALQEVLSPDTCAAFDEPDPERTCHASDERPPAVRRLLGDDYSITCDARRQVDCLGVHRRFGTIVGVPAGGLVLDGAETAALPYRACDAIAGRCDGRADECDAESSVSAITVWTERGPLRVVHLHPTAVGDTCRQRQLIQAFELGEPTPALLLGDWNFDPDDGRYSAEAAVWASFVGESERFRDHAPRTSDCRAVATSVGRALTLDRVVTDFARADCRVWRSPSLDDPFDPATLPLDTGPIDHYAVECGLGRR